MILVNKMCDNEYWDGEMNNPELEFIEFMDD